MNKLKEYFLCARPHSFPAAIAPVLVGTSFAMQYHHTLNIKRFLLFILACLLIQAATNFFNEYYDYKKGLDKIDSQGISGSILKKKLTEKEVFYGAILLYIIAIIIGIYLSYLTSYLLFVVGLVSMLFGYLYTGGKYPIAYSPFGELVAGFFMGSVIIAIAFYLQTHFINSDVFIISLPIFLLIGAILLANNIRDLDNDKVSGRKTLAILLDKKNAVSLLMIIFITVYTLNILFIFFKFGTIYYLLTLITIPLAKKIILGFKQHTTKEEMAPYMVLTAKLTIFIGFIISIAHLLNIII